MDFEVPTEVRQINRAVDQFIEQEIHPLEEEYDQFLGEDAEMNIVDGPGEDYMVCDDYIELWKTIRRRSSEAGFHPMDMPAEMGGGGLSTLEFVLVLEHIKNRNPDGFHHLIVEGPSKIMLPMYEDEYQRENYFGPYVEGDKLYCFALTEPDHGSDATHMDTTASRDGDEWVINGKKAFASKGAFSDFVLVHTRTSGNDGDLEGITTFIVDRDNPGMTVEKVQRPMGATMPGRQSILSFDECRVGDNHVLGEPGEGFLEMINWIGSGRLTVPATSVGRSQWMLDATVKYAKEREVFGQDISNYQGVAFQLADAAAEIEQARWLTRYAAWKVDRGDRAVRESSIAKLKGAKMWNRVADIAVQVHGGSGFMRSLPFEKEYREARASRIYEGTDEIQKRQIAKELL